MTWEVCQALTQAKDDGERMERRIQELGEEANNLEVCLDDAESEIVRLKIAHLWRMAESIRIVLDRHLISAETEAEYERKKRRRNERATRFAKACLAKITELKESRCSTKS